MSRKNIESDGIFRVRRVNQHHIVHALWRNDAANAVNQVAMRVKDGHALTVFNVLPDEIEKQRGFAGAARADDVGVTRALFCREADCSGFTSMFILAKQYSCGLADNAWRWFGFACLSNERRRTNGTRGDVNETHEFVAV